MKAKNSDGLTLKQIQEHEEKKDGIVNTIYYSPSSEVHAILEIYKNVDDFIPYMSNNDHIVVNNKKVYLKIMLQK